MLTRVGMAHRSAGIMSLDMEAIAKRAGVARPTVSCVLNNRWVENRISKETRDRILATAKELGYFPHAIAKGLASNKTHNIAIALRSVEYPAETYFAVIIGGIIHQVGLHDYNLQFTVTDRQAGDSAQNLLFTKKVRERCIDGVIIIDQCVPDREVLWLRDMGMPFVLVDRFVPQEGVSSVRVDNKEGIFLVTEHLMRLGHQRIGFVLESLTYCKSSEMLNGYGLALSKHGLRSSNAFVHGVLEREQESVFGTVETLLALPEPPTAIVCSSDKIAVTVLGMLKARGMQVPRDIALTGYNEDPNFAHTEPQLTSVRVPLRELGEEAARMLFDLIDGQQLEKKEIILEPELVVRESCGAKDVQGRQARADK